VTGQYPRREVMNMSIRSARPETPDNHDVTIPAGSVQLDGELIVPGALRVSDGCVTGPNAGSAEEDQYARHG